jgi:hypothetical protein
LICCEYVFKIKPGLDSLKHDPHSLTAILDFGFGVAIALIRRFVLQKGSGLGESLLLGSEV